jgi:hypothetical protein
VRTKTLSHIFRNLLFVADFVYNSRIMRSERRTNVAPRLNHHAGTPGNNGQTGVAGLLPRLIIVLAVCLMAVALLAAPTRANDEPPAPFVDGFSPISGVPGDIVTVTGGNLTAGQWVDIHFHSTATGSIPVATAIADEAGRFRVEFEVPDTPARAYLAQVAADGEIYHQRTFTVRSGLTVSPGEGLVGDSATVIGRGYGQNQAGIWLYFKGERVAEDRDIQADAHGRWTISFEIPPSISGSHTINTSPSANRPTSFTVTPGIMTERSSGSPGQTITVTGGGFGPNDRRIRVLFGGEAVAEGIRSDETGSWEGSFEIPALLKGTYIVTAEGDFTRREDVAEVIFAVRPGIVLSPAEGHVGTNVTAYGGGFGRDQDVTVLYEDIEVATATTDENGIFEVTFTVPESRHGPRQVTGEDSTGNTTDPPAIFSMETDPPPTPELILPEDGDRVGFASRVRPRFKWSEVEDESGVYYDLQISASANVTATGEFVHPLVPIERLVGANYTLPRADALPHGTYYWIVRAVDGAENAGNWTAVYSFRAGRLPLWTFIVIIVFAALGAGAGVYVYVVRKRRYY